jgi:uncharacterized protein (UPF0333 family)
MKPRHNAEQSTTTVNKMQMTGKRGFAVLRDKQITSNTSNPTEEKTNIADTIIAQENITLKIEVPVINNAPNIIKPPESSDKINIHMPEDPQEKFLCESCQ